jgi:hypothetical protein
MQATERRQDRGARVVLLSSQAACPSILWTPDVGLPYGIRRFETEQTERVGQRVARTSTLGASVYSETNARSLQAPDSWPRSASLRAGASPNRRSDS